MKAFKSIAAVILSAAMILSLCACHKKGETVVTVGDTKIDSGLYLALQYTAYSQFISDVREDPDASIPSDASYSYFNDLTHPEDGLSMIDWVTDRTNQMVKEYGAVKYLCSQNNISLSASEEETVDQYANAYWESQGMKLFYEDFGVSYNTYRETIAHNFLTSKLFYFYYGTADDKLPGSGSKAVSDQEVSEAINGYAVLVDHLDNKLSATYDEDGNATAVTDEEREAAKAKLQGYADRINRGTSFDTIKAEYAAETGATDTDTASTVPSSDTATSIYTATATAYTKNDSDATNYNLFDGFKSTDGFEYGKAMVVEGDTDDFKLVIIYDLSKDPYYCETYHDAIVRELKSDEFEDFLAQQADSIGVSENSSLVKFYRPEKINFDKAAQNAAS